MPETINYNEKVLANYQKMYPNLQGFVYSKDDDSLVYNGEKVSLNGNSLSHIDPVFFEMSPEDIFSFLKNGFYLNNSDSIHVSALLEQFVITEEEVTFLENFARKFNERCRIYANNKDLLDRLSDSNVNVKSFCKELIESHRIVYQAQMEANASIIGTNAASILYQAYEHDLNDSSKQNTNEESLNNERRFALTRIKPNSGMNYEDFEAMEKEYMNSKDRLGVAGFTSILLLIAVTAAAGIYLALSIMP